MRHFLSILAFLALVPLSALAEDPGFRFKDCYIEVTLHEDNTLDVSEMYSVHFTLQSHGIYRTLPALYSVYRDVSDKQDRTELHKFEYEAELEDVHCNNTFTWDRDEDQDEFYYIRIGSSDETVIGDQHYAIKYHYIREDDRTEKGDLFFHTIYGPGWECTADKVHFRLNLDKDVPIEYLKDIVVYYGERERTDRCITFNDLRVSADKRTIEGEVAKLKPHDCITFFLPLPEGYYQGEKTRHAQWFAYIPLALLLTASIYLILFCIFRRRKHVTVGMEAFPPEGLTSAEVGTIIDNSADSSDLISLILWLASKGYITIDCKGKAPKLHRIKDVPADSPQYLRDFMDLLFSKSDTMDLKGQRSQKFEEKWNKCLTQLSKHFEGDKELEEWPGAFTCCMPILIPFLAVLLLWSNTPDHMTGFIYGLLTAAGMVVIGGIRLGTWATDDTRSKLTWALLIMACGCVAAWHLGTILLIYNTDNLIRQEGAIAWALALGFLACGLVGRLPDHTKYKVEMQGRLLGLKKFIHDSERPMLEQLLLEEEHYFYDILPFAMALDEGDRWVKRFEGLQMTRPDWYVDNGTKVFTTAALYETMEHSVGTKMRDIKQPPRSSGSSSGFSGGGGGGFSGGGSGGGGGGRW